MQEGANESEETKCIYFSVSKTSLSLAIGLCGSFNVFPNKGLDIVSAQSQKTGINI